MVRSKKPIDEAFHEAVTNNLGARSPYVVARDAGLTMNSISRAIEGVDPQLSRAIEVAHALGFEIRYEWPLGSETHRQAAGLAIRSMRLFGSRQFREILKMKGAEALLERFAVSYANYLYELGPTCTGDPDKACAQILRVLMSQEKAGMGRQDDE